MARLNNNAWIHGHSDDTFGRNSGDNTVINLIIDAQSAHGIFSIASSNQLKWQGNAYPGTGNFVCYVWGNTRDGDDNEGGGTKESRAQNENTEKESPTGKEQELRDRAKKLLETYDNRVKE